MTVVEKMFKDGKVQISVGKKVYVFDNAKDYMDFLKLPYKEEILDDVEKRYLRNIVRPFYDKVICVRKTNHCMTGKDYIAIEMYNDSNILLPNFEKGSMYTGMEYHKCYTLKELGIKK